VLTAPVAMLVDAVTFAASAVLIGGVRVQDPPVDLDGAPPLLKRAREGMALVLRHPYLRVSLGFATTVNFFSFVWAAVLVLYASRHLGLSAGVIGLALGIGASGGLLGAVLARRVTGRLGVGRTIMLGSVLFAAPVALLPLADGPLWARAAVLGLVEFVGGLGVMWLDVPLNALQTAVIPDEVRSRVAGAFSSVNYGVRPLGAVLGGFLGEWIGVAPTLVVAAAGGALAVLWLVGSPIGRTRTIEELDGVAEAVRRDPVPARTP
jgi:predicted MFS family arabinose efflux permease